MEFKESSLLIQGGYGLQGLSCIVPKGFCNPKILAKGLFSPKNQDKPVVRAMLAELLQELSSCDHVWNLQWKMFGAILLVLFPQDM